MHNIIFLTAVDVNERTTGRATRYHLWTKDALQFVRQLTSTRSVQDIPKQRNRLDRFGTVDTLKRRRTVNGLKVPRVQRRLKQQG